MATSPPASFPGISDDDILLASSGLPASDLLWPMVPQNSQCH